MNNQVNYDRIIEKEDIADATLALLANQDPLSVRPPGIFTLDDLLNIKNYVQSSLAFPTKNDDILKWFNIDESTKLPIPATELTDIILNIREHANNWDNVEQQVKQQSIDLALTSRNITQTGKQVIEYINHMPIIKQKTSSLDELSQEQLADIKYQSDDQQIATELVCILEYIKNDIKQQSIKTIKTKNTVSDFRVHIIGGYLSDFQHVESLMFNVKGIYQQLDSANNDNSEDFLKEQIIHKKQEVHQLELEYDHFVKLCFTGLAGGIIGLIITGSIFGIEAEKIRKLKNAALQEIQEMNKKMNQDQLIKKTIFEIQISLQKIEGFFKDARLAVDHLDYMWLAILTEINQSIDVFKKINDADKLIRFVVQFKRIISSWAAIKDYSVHLISVFDESLENEI